MPLSDFAIRSAKPRTKPYKLADAAGLYIYVQPSGSRLWRMAYRFNGKQKLLSFGAYPALSLADARVRRETAKRHIANGLDPAVQKRIEEAAALDEDRKTFGSIAAEIIKRCEKAEFSPQTMRRYRRMLLGYAGPQLGHRPIREITPHEILRLLKGFEEKDQIATARILRGLISIVFRHAIATLRADNDPTYPLRGAIKTGKARNHSAITNHKELGKLLIKIDGYQGTPLVRYALQLLILTFVRSIEVRGAKWSEIDFDNATWSIPAERMKMRREHDVPLSRQAVDLLRNVQRFSGNGEYIFPSTRTQAVVSSHAFSSLLNKIGYSGKVHTPHGFRSSASTILNGCRRFNPDVIEMQLAHLDGGSVRRVYNRAKYWPERVELMQAWADMLGEFRET